MKRLIKKAQSIELYHGTNLLNVDSILSTGFKAGSEGKVWNNTNVNQTFFDVDADHVMEWYCINAVEKAGDRPDDAWAIFKVGLDTNILVPDLDDNPDAKTWEESVDRNGQVAVNGSVPASVIKEIILIDPDEEYEIFRGTPADYSINKDKFISEWLASKGM